VKRLKADVSSVSHSSQGWLFTFVTILGDPGAASRDDGIFMSESLQQERECPRKIFFWPINEEEQPGDSHAFLHEGVFLINRRSSVARSTGTFLRRASEKNKIK